MVQGRLPGLPLERMRGHAETRLDAFLDAAGLEIVTMPRPALFLAGKVFTQYRKSGGSRAGVLPDFFIGAHAVISDSLLITRDAARYRTYFPGIMLLAPN